MFELNDQELEQVAGGKIHYGSHSSADGVASAYLGAASSSSEAGSKVTSYYAKSYAANTSEAIGYGVVAASESSTAAGAHN